MANRLYKAAAKRAIADLLNINLNGKDDVRENAQRDEGTPGKHGDAF